MASDVITDLPMPILPASGSAAVLPALPDLEHSLETVRHQMEQLLRQRDQLAETAKKQEAELAVQRDALKSLQVDRDKYKELARAFMQVAYPRDQAIVDLENYPPSEQCHLADEVLAELEGLHKSLAELQRS